FLRDFSPGPGLAQRFGRLGVSHRKPSLKTDRDRSRAVAKLEFGRAERWLIEEGADVVRESERFLGNADPAHVKASVSVDILEQLYRVSAGFQTVETRRGFGKGSAYHLVCDRFL